MTYLLLVVALLIGYKCGRFIGHRELEDQRRGHQQK